MGKGETVEFEAATRPSDGYIHITGESLPVSRVELIVDERAIPPAGRIGETEDLIGSVFVKDGKVSTLTTVTPQSSEAKGRDSRGREGASGNEETENEGDTADDRWSQIHMMPSPPTDSLRVMVP